MKLQDFRREYQLDGLRREQLNTDPIAQFETWLQQAMNSGLSDPTAMTLATVNEQGQPSQRIVLLKQVDHQGFVFFTNKDSSKGRAMAVNPKVSLHFPWYPLERQVRVLGVVKPLSEQQVTNYFASRPKESQLAAWASEQSQEIPSREYLMDRYESLLDEYADKDAPLPKFWGGYQVVPSQIEFWQGGEHRLHDRFEYTLDTSHAVSNGDNEPAYDQNNKQQANVWNIQRLAP